MITYAIFPFLHVILLKHRSFPSLHTTTFSLHDVSFSLTFLRVHFSHSRPEQEINTVVTVRYSGMKIDSVVTVRYNGMRK